MQGCGVREANRNIAVDQQVPCWWIWIRMVEGVSHGRILVCFEDRITEFVDSDIVIYSNKNMQSSSWFLATVSQNL